jgi:hypothetical protein
MLGLFVLMKAMYLLGATRRALGRVKKCNCKQPYLCSHNKTASFNTRRPLKVVVQYRRNARRLKAAGRPDEASAWNEKARLIDEQEQVHLLHLRLYTLLYFACFNFVH